MGRLHYLSALQFVDAVVGNSSSGLLEAPSFKITTIDIGDRQKGRIKGSSVISCLPNKTSIGRAFIKSFSEEFQGILSEAENPYGSGGASKKIFNIIRSFSLDGIIKKRFNNINLNN
jgi:GDP/UDP-N,N'-diacetylbacillosamine 2-epimerase (hydrolysing)